MEISGPGICPICNSANKISYSEENPIIREDKTLKLYHCLRCGFEGIETYIGNYFVGHSENMGIH